MYLLSRPHKRTGKVIDYDYRTTAKSLGITINKVSGDDLATFPIEKARIRSIWYFIAVSISSTVIYGWVVDAQVHLSVALIMQFLCGLGMTGVFNVRRDPRFQCMCSDRKLILARYV